LQPLGDPRIYRPWALVRLLAGAFGEIVRSSFNVRRIILFGKAKDVRSQFIRIPLDLQDAYGLALLSCLINSTPGTVWLEILADGHESALYLCDRHDERWGLNTITARYEEPIIGLVEGGRVS